MLWTGLEDETKLLLDSEPQSLPLEEVRRRLPEGVTLAQYSVLQDRVLIWTLRCNGEGEQFITQPIGREELEGVVARSRDFESVEGEKASNELFKLLVLPWLSTVPEEERHGFIPDKALHWVPFNSRRETAHRVF